MFGKFFATTFTGSMMGSGTDVFAVWGYVIANAQHSQIELNPKLLAAVLGSTPEAMQAAIDVLCAPDPNSRSVEHNGMRLLREGQFAYHVVNHEKYRALRNDDDRREYFRQKKAESRARLSGETVKVRSQRKSNCPPLSTAVTQPESRTRKQKAEQQKQEEPSFPTSLNTPEFRQAWADYKVHRRESKMKPLGATATKTRIAELEKMGPTASVEAIRRSIANGWAGIFPDNGNGANGKASHDCDRCAGKGFIEKPDSCGGWTMVKEPCKRCQGTGKF